MKRAVLATCLVTLFACQKKEASVPSELAEPAPTPAAAPAAPTPEPEEKKIEITEELVKRYMGFEKEKIELTLAVLADVKTKIAKMDKDQSTVSALRGVADLSERGKKLDEEIAKRRAKASLSEEAVKELDELLAEVQGGRLLWRNAGGDAAIAQTEKDLKAQLASMPAERREEAKAQMATVIESMKAMRDNKEARSKYGDQAVDWILKYGDEVMKLREEVLKTGLGR